MSDDLLSVEETAARLGVSEATVRRMAADGRLGAERAGRAWVVRAETLPARRHRGARGRTTATTAGLVNLHLSLKQLRNQDLKKDVWVRDVLLFEDDLADPASVLAAAADRLNSKVPFDPAVNVPVPKSAFFSRNSVDLSLPDRLAYHAVVQASLPLVSARLGPEAFAARPSTTPDYLLQKGTDQWLLWKTTVRRDIQQSNSWMAETDVTAFFDFIQHGSLLTELRDAGVAPQLIDVLREMLRAWSTTSNAGLPQGPDASRVLGNFYMQPVDQAMTALPGVRYYRYMDDIRIVGERKAAVLTGLQRLDVECRRRGLALSTKKTELHHGASACDRLIDTDLDAAQYIFEKGKNSRAKRSEMVKIFTHALQKDGNLDRRRAAFSLWRLFQLREQRVRQKVLRNLESLGQLGWMVPAYLHPWLRNPSVQRQLSDFLKDPDRNTSDYLSTWLIAGMLDVGDRIPREWIDYARRISLDKAQPAYHRAVALNLLALGRQPRDITALEDTVRFEYDPVVVRAAVVGLARVKKLSRPVANSSKRIDGLDRTIMYLSGRVDLPSLIFFGKRNEIV